MGHHKRLADSQADKAAKTVRNPGLSKAHVEALVRKDDRHDKFMEGSDSKYWCDDWSVE